MDGRIANVSFETVEDAAVIVGIYDESGVQMLLSASANVSAGDTQVQVTMENSLLSYFCLRSFLVARDSMRPLCTAYSSPMYTQEMQEFLSKKTTDVSVSLGDRHSGAITKDGSLYMWGLNGLGQLGDGTTINRSTPTQIALPSSIRTHTQAQPMLSQNSEARSNMEARETSKPSVCAANSDTLASVQTKTFTGLEPQELYQFYVMKSRNAKQPFDADNLLYAGQGVSDGAGKLDVSYIPTKDIKDAEAFVVGRIQPDLADADIRIEEMFFNGAEQNVWPEITYKGDALTEGIDYTLSGDISFSSAGSYTLTASGIGKYTGEIQAAYQVKEADNQINGDYIPPMPNPPVPPQPDTNPIVNPTPQLPKQDYEQKPGDQTPDTPKDPDVVIHEKGVQVTDQLTNTVYKILNTSGTDKLGGTVSFLGKEDKTIERLTVPETVMLDGVSYKVTKIDAYAFQNYPNLSTVVIRDGVQSIGDSAFYGCENLNTVVLGTGITSIGAKAFRECRALTEIVIPDTTTVIEDQAFYNCKSLKIARLGKGVKEIGRQAFYGCQRLKSVTLRKNVTRIGAMAFYKCKALKKISIPAKITYIGTKAFYGCRKLKSITIKTAKLKSSNVGIKAFGKTPAKAKVKVPKKVYKKYKKLLRKKGVHKKALIRSL